MLTTALLAAMVVLDPLCKENVKDSTFSTLVSSKIFKFMQRTSPTVSPEGNVSVEESIEKSSLPDYRVLLYTCMDKN